jgi:hypothetical protein
MSLIEIHPNDGESLLSELNAATEQMMAIALHEVGNSDWHRAHIRQQAAFATWLRYLRRDPAVKRQQLGSAAA